MATANYPGGRSETFEGALKDVLSFAEKSIEQGAETVEIVSGRQAGDAPAPGAEGAKETERLLGSIPRIVRCGEFVKVNIARELDGRPQTDQWRPAIVVEAWTPETINAVAFLDGVNDRAYGGAVDQCTLWVTSATHGFGPIQWCWPDELDDYVWARAFEAPSP